MIELIDLYKSFGTKKVLQGASLTIEKGETMVIIGGSGTGKSVMIKHMIGLLSPDAGRVIVDGKEVTRLSERELNELRKKFGMLFQGGALFDSMTVGENVGFPIREHTRLTKGEINRIVEEKLELVGLRGVQHLKPSELSGGMQKRVGLARAIAMNAEIILYDEPTTGLDPIMADVINDLIVDLSEKLNITSIVITHDMVSTNKIADRIAMLYNGKIVQVGTPDEIMFSEKPEVRDFVWIGKVIRQTEAIAGRTAKRGANNAQ